MRNSEYWFLATPYRSHPLGPEGSFEDTSRALALLANAGISAYSLIVQMHPAMKYGAPPATDDFFWESFSAPMISRSKGLIVCNMPGLYHSPDMRSPSGNDRVFKSVGVEEEIENFKFAGKPVVFMNPAKAPTKIDLETPPTTRRLSIDEYAQLAFRLNEDAVSALRFFGSKYNKSAQIAAIGAEMKSAVEKVCVSDAEKVVLLSRSIRSGLRFFKSIKYDRDRDWHVAEAHDTLKKSKIFYDESIAVAPLNDLQNQLGNSSPIKPGL